MALFWAVLLKAMAGSDPSAYREFLLRIGGFERCRRYQHQGEEKLTEVVVRRIEYAQPVFAQDAQFLAANTEARDISLSILRLFASLIPVIMFAINLATLMILTLGGRAYLLLVLLLLVFFFLVWLSRRSGGGGASSSSSSGWHDQASPISAASTNHRRAWVSSAEV